jgi:hypothetical protein
VPAKVTKLIGLKRPPFLSPTNLIIFACTQNNEFGYKTVKINTMIYLIRPLFINLKFLKIDIGFLRPNFMKSLLHLLSINYQNFYLKKIQFNFKKLKI